MKVRTLLGGLALFALSAPALAQPAPAPAEPLLGRLEALEARIRQLEARNAELEARQGETTTRVKQTETRVATAVQSGVAPTFSDPGGSFVFKPRGMMQIDYAAYNMRAGGYDFSNGTDIRRGRIGFDGTAFGKLRYRVESELVKKQAVLLDAYVQYAIDPALLLTVGQHKAPAGLEANGSDAFNSFLERGMANSAFGAIGAERRVGLSLAYSSAHLHAQASLFSAAEDFTRANRVDESHGLNGRIVWEPVTAPGRLVHFGASAWSATNFAGDGLTIAERPGSRVDDGRLVSATIANVQRASFIGAEAALVRGPVSVQGEYGRIAIDRTGTLPSVGFDGFYLFGSWLVTGESRSFRGGTADRIRPKRNFDPAKGQWGALELLLRYDELDLTDADLSPLARKGTSWTGGINWYLNPNARLIFNYIRFSGQNSPLFVLPTPAVIGADRTARGDIFHTRLQFDF